MKPLVLINYPLGAKSRAAIGEKLEVVFAPNEQAYAEAVGDRAQQIRLALTIGTVGMTAADMDRLPNLEFISAMGIGHEGIDVQAAKERGIAVTNNAGTNEDCVADHAMALLLSSIRRIVELDRIARIEGERVRGRVDGVGGKRVGILGLGAIGQHVATRASAFGMPIGYHSRSEKPGGYQYFDSPVALAEWADCLVVATPGGPQTKHLVDADVLRALGPAGYLVNIARGSVVDTAALADVLRSPGLAGAALDVYESEPHPPAELLEFDNVTLTPHVGGGSPDTDRRAVEGFLDNVERHLSGKPLRTPLW